MQNTHFSLIIPTYLEAQNLPELIRRIACMDDGTRMFEVLLMDDDSKDGSMEIVRELSRDYPWLNMMVHTGKRNHAQAVVSGIQQAKYPVIVIMDADLSHPPEKIPLLLEALDEQVDVVLGSRYIKGGSVDSDWPLIRRMTSGIATMMARIFFYPQVKDPLSGFMAVRKNILLQGESLTTIGWKINLELMVKSRCKIIREIPIDFVERTRGKSKLNVWISMQSFYQMMKLVRFKVM